MGSDLVGRMTCAPYAYLRASITGFAACLAFGACAEAAMIDRSGEPQVELGVVGHIAQSCSLGAIDAAHIADLAHATDPVTGSMPIHCNVPFQLNISSQNGGIVNTTKGPGAIGGWSGRVGYSLTVGIPVLYPTSGWVQGVYNASDLTSGKSLSSNGGVAFDHVHVELKMEALSGAGLLAGDYSDVIRFSVSPQV